MVLCRPTILKRALWIGDVETATKEVSTNRLPSQTEALCIAHDGAFSTNGRALWGCTMMQRTAMLPLFPCAIESQPRYEDIIVVERGTIFLCDFASVFFQS